MRSRRFARAMTATVVVVVAVSLAALSASASGSSDAPRNRTSVTPVTLPPTAITTYDVQVGAKRILDGEGGVWTFEVTPGSPGTLHRVDLGSEPIVGEFSMSGAPPGPAFSDGKLWTLGLDDQECAPSDFHYVVRTFDPASSAVTASVVLPQFCRYGSDNRDPWPAYVIGGGTVWLTIAGSANGPGPTQIVTVDMASGNVSFPPVTGSVYVLAADGTGAWTFDIDLATFRTPNAEDNLGLPVLEGVGRLGRLDPSGNVVATDLLQGGTVLTPVSPASDRTGLWVAYAPKPSTPRGPQRIALAHVTPAGRVVVAKDVSAWSIATGDDQVWFLGLVGRARTSKAGLLANWLLGQVDPRTGRVMRTLHLALPLDPSPTATRDLTSLLRIGAVMDGAVWLEYTYQNQKLFRVAVDGR
jgi:hypothetical protein